MPSRRASARQPGSTTVVADGFDDQGRALRPAAPRQARRVRSSPSAPWAAVGVAAHWCLARLAGIASPACPTPPTASADRRLDDRPSRPVVSEAEALAVRGLEIRAHLVARSSPAAPATCRCPRSRSARATRDVGAARPRPASSNSRRAAPLELGRAPPRSRSPAAAASPARGSPHVGQAHAVGREHAGKRVDHHRSHAERVGDQAGMLAAGAAEACQRVAADVVAARDRDLLDRIGHVVDGDARGSPPRSLRRARRPVAGSTCAAISANRAATPSASSGWSPSGPNTRGK